MHQGRSHGVRAGGRQRIGSLRGTVNLSATGGDRMISWARDWGRQVVRWVGDGADLLFPRSCQWCRREGDLPEAPELPEHGLCQHCVRELVEKAGRCPRCGAESATGAACPAGRCRAVGWDGVVFLGGYDAALREAVLKIKRPGAEDLARGLAVLLVEKHRSELEAARCDVVVPVPMHWWRRSLRGTSAAEEIARAVGRALRLPVATALRRCRNTRMQNELPAEERAANVADAFRVRGAWGGRRLLVIDDVVTTGATLSACAAALRAAGAAAVYGAAVARAEGLSAGARRRGS